MAATSSSTKNCVNDTTSATNQVTEFGGKDKVYDNFSRNWGFFLLTHDSTEYNFLLEQAVDAVNIVLSSFREKAAKLKPFTETDASTLNVLIRLVRVMPLGYKVIYIPRNSVILCTDSLKNLASESGKYENIAFLMDRDVIEVGLNGLLNIITCYMGVDYNTLVCSYDLVKGIQQSNKFSELLTKMLVVASNVINNNKTGFEVLCKFNIKFEKTGQRLFKQVALTGDLNAQELLRVELHKNMVFKFDTFYECSQPAVKFVWDQLGIIG